MSVINPVISQVIRPVTQPPTKPPKGGGGGGNRDAQVMDVTLGNTETLAASYTIPMPQNAIAGELLVALVYRNNSPGTFSTATSGWTVRGQTDVGAARGAAVLTKTAAGTDAALVVSATGTGAWGHFVFVIDNADVSAPVFAESLDFDGTAKTSQTISSLSTDSKNDICLAFVGANTTAGVTSMSGTGWTDLGTLKDGTNTVSYSAAYKSANNNRTSGDVTANYPASISNNAFGQVIIAASGGKSRATPRLNVYSTLAAAESSGDTWTDGQAVYVTGSSGSGAVQFKYYSALDQT